MTDFEPPPQAARRPGHGVLGIPRAALARERGRVVITACGHAGVIDSGRQVQQSTGVEKVHAIVGGCRLAPASDKVVAKTVAAVTVFGA